MEKILKLIKYYAYILIQYMVKALFFTYIYNWFVPVLFPVFPIIDKAEGMTIILIAEFLLSDKADHIYSENTSYGMMTICNIIRYVIYLSVAFIMKKIIGI